AYPCSDLTKVPTDFRKNADDTKSVLPKTDDINDGTNRPLIDPFQADLLRAPQRWLARQKVVVISVISHRGMIDEVGTDEPIVTQPGDPDRVGSDTAASHW